MHFFRQDDVERKCCICNKLIMRDDFMLDLFRRNSGNSRVRWAHATCIRSTIEFVIEKRDARRGGEKQK